MSTTSRPNNIHRLLSAATAAVPLPSPNPPFPAQTRHNPPKPATTSPISQNKPSPALLRAYPHLKTDQDVKTWIESLRAQNATPIPPAQTRHNPPQSATKTPSPQIEPTTPQPTLQPRQRQAARLLIAGRTAKAIAAELAVDRHTISDWKKLPAFQQEIDRLLRHPTPKSPMPNDINRKRNLHPANGGQI